MLANRAKPESNYKRLTRFLREFPVDFDDIDRAIVSWSPIPQPWTLSLDRTNGSFGSVHFNILMLGIVHEGVAFPLFWTMLDKRGNSNSNKRVDLLERFERVFPNAKVRCLTGDREFVGKDGCIETLFSALKTRGFNLESTHLCHAERLSKLVALLALGFCWAMRSGLWHHQHQPIAIKAHGRRAKSLFRCGCDFLRRTCCDLALHSDEFDQVLQLLSPY